MAIIIKLENTISCLIDNGFARIFPIRDGKMKYRSVYVQRQKAVKKLIPFAPTATVVKFYNIVCFEIKFENYNNKTLMRTLNHWEITS